jgi:mannose-1-phosphate guanylyltransferase
MKTYAIIMAGGVGARFWPYGLNKLPKQFLPIADSNETMLQQTVKRIENLIPPDRVFIVTNRSYIRTVREQVPKVPATNIIGEPVARNTAPCIGLAALMLKQFHEESVMFVLPADHLITNKDDFLNTVSGGIRFAASNDAIVTMGITPTRPETGYGYIQYIDDIHRKVVGDHSDVLVYKVKTFAEKPNLETAKVFLESGDFVWNSGMFIFRTDVILNEFKRSLPDVLHSLQKAETEFHSNKFERVLDQVFGEIKSISIDYGIMEKADNVYVIKGSFVWSDLGSWDEYYKLKPKDAHNNAVVGDAFIKDSNNNLILSTEGFTGVIGADNLLIVNTKEGLLVCRRDRSQEVKEIVDYLKRKGLTDFI